jgi:hypothetical protein
MANDVGLDQYSYLNGGTHNSPTWGLLSSISDLSTSGSKTETPALSRGSIFDFQMEGTVKAPIKFTMLRIADATNYAAFKNAWLSRGTVMDMAFANGPIATTGTLWFRADYAVFGFDEKQNLEDPVTSDVSINLVYSANVPAMHTT